MNGQDPLTVCMQSESLFLIADFFRQELLTHVGIPSKGIEYLSLGRARVGVIELIIKNSSTDQFV